MMFVHMLNNTEKRSMLKLMAFLSLIDGKVTEEEVLYIGEAATVMGLSPIGIFEETSEKTLRELCSELETTQSKLLAIFELINIANIDGHYDDAEKNGIRNIADLLGVPVSKIEELESLSESGLVWMSKCKAALGIL